MQKEITLPPSSGLESEGCADTQSRSDDRLNIKQAAPLSTAVARFINRRNGSVTVTIDYAYGGYSNATLSRQGDHWDVHCRTSSPYDVYCWNVNGPCTPDGSLTCVGGNTYYVG